MAIPSKETNQVEVRIKRYPQSTYFDKNVKAGDDEKRDASSCERYIAPEAGQMYTVETTLKKGYQFGNCKIVQAALYLPGFGAPVSMHNFHKPKDVLADGYLQDDLVAVMEYTGSSKPEGRPLSGSRFVFHQLAIGN